MSKSMSASNHGCRMRRSRLPANRRNRQRECQPCSHSNAFPTPSILKEPMTPRIALPVPTSTDLAYNQRAIPHYAEAIRRSGGEPVEIGISANPAQIREIIATCQGVCLPGSPADVDPADYGADRDPETAPADSAREATDRL